MHAAASDGEEEADGSITASPSTPPALPPTNNAGGGYISPTSAMHVVPSTPPPTGGAGAAGGYHNAIGQAALAPPRESVFGFQEDVFEIDYGDNSSAANTLLQLGGRGPVLMEQMDDLAKCTAFFVPLSHMERLMKTWAQTCTSLVGRTLSSLLQELQEVNDKHNVFNSEDLQQMYSDIATAFTTKNN
jgi:hypothetical protein